MLKTYQPADGTPKTFAVCCGSNLFGGGFPDGDHTTVRLTAPDTPFGGGPQLHMFMRSVASWEHVPDDDLPQFDTDPA